MATIEPGRLLDVTNAADFVALTETNFEILSAELFKSEATYQNGSPNTVIGPPSSGDHVLAEVWKDSLGAVWVCVTAGNPGTWRQVTPASVSADPSSGTIPTGYVIVRPDQGWAVKRHAGAYAWETVVGASGGKIGFYGATPVVQPSGADQVAVTLGNTDGEIGGLTISDPPTQAEVQALRDTCEELADDVHCLIQKGLWCFGVPQQNVAGNVSRAHVPSTLLKHSPPYLEQVPKFAAVEPRAVMFQANVNGHSEERLALHRFLATRTADFGLQIIFK